MYSEKVLDEHETLLTAATSTVATVRHLGGIPLERLSEIRVRLNVTQGFIGDTPTGDIYLQRAVAAEPDPDVDADWEDFYHFPQFTTTPIDKVVTLPLPQAQDVDASLASYGRTRAVESLAADTVIGGHWMGPIRIREKRATGGAISQAAIYDVEMMGR